MHGDTSQPGPHESKYAELFRGLIGNPRTDELIAPLSNSDNEWVRQGALFAARGPFVDSQRQN